MPNLQELYARIDGAKAELDALRPLDREREARVMQKFRLWWTYHSNAIEGNKLSQGETEMFLMDGLTAKGKPFKDYLDLRGHNDAIQFLLSLVKDKQEITESDIRSLHTILLAEPYTVPAVTPDGIFTTKMVAIGEYKSLPNHVKTPTGETHYYANPEETPAKMHDLIRWYRAEKVRGLMHPVEIAARFHHRFTDIHPFDDGNGRMSRLLTNLMLMQNGYPPIVIRIGERDDYLAALRSADRGDYDDFIALVGEHAVESLHLFIQAARGKEISEPTDLRKEIALERLRLQHIEEPVTRSSDLLQNLYEGSLNTLVTEAIRQLAQFAEFFTNDDAAFKSTVTLNTTTTYNQYHAALSEADFSQHVKNCFGSGLTITATHVQFSFIGFRKGRFDTFDVATSLAINCEPLKYSVQVQMPPHKALQHFYQESLTGDEITAVVEQMARYVLKTIQEKTKTS
jgi:Fic family protein